jgi:glycosyltransferase involved in cell wall biosynthesis
MSAPPVSVLVTTYNHARYVDEALESLRAQTSRDFEVIITDDASPDGTADVIAAWLARTGFPAQFIRNAENRGICANRNAALARTSGAFVCSLSGDDAYEPDRVERQLAAFLQQPERVAVVYSDAFIVDAEGRDRGVSYLSWQIPDEPPPSGRLFERFVRSCFVCAPAAMMRRSAIEAVGGYDEALVYEDYDMFLRLSYRFDFAYLPGRLVRWRELPSSLSHSRQGRAAMRASDIRILGRWVGVGLDEETEKVILDKLWANGKLELYWRRNESARASFAAAVVPGTRLDRRLIAQLVRLPGGCETVRSLGLLARRLRGRPPLPEISPMARP